MKGLLLKDLYMLFRYGASYLLILIVFSAVSFFGNNNILFTVYPVIFAGIMPVSLLSYDEKSRWINYAMTLPYSRRQIVSSKYIISIIILFAAVLYICLIQTVKSVVMGSGMYFIKELAIPMLVGGILPQSLLLPLVFKLGVEKGRIGYMIVIFAICASIPIMSEVGVNVIYQNTATVLVILFVTVLFIISWLLSIKLFENREL